MSEHSKAPDTDRLKQARSFWDGSADWNALRAIYDSEEVRDEATAEEAFDEAGVGDAQRLAAYVHPGSRVVDLGCGIGRVMRPLAPHCREIIGVDISEKMIERGREYLAGVPNARLVLTSGAELPGIGDGSIDFLFSLICLIHVDKRAAFRYMREARRVLAPDGRALLQFENILSDEGLAEFQRVVDLDVEYPLEFYSRDEVRQLARAAGLDVLSFEQDREFLYATLVRGSADDWIRQVGEGVRLEVQGAEGAFDGSGREGRVVVEGASSLESPCTLRVGGVLRRVDGLEPVYWFEAPIVLRPGATHRIELVHQAAGEALVLVDGQPAPLARNLPGTAPPQGDVELLAGFAPPGFALDEDTAEIFPGFFPRGPIRGRLE